MFIHIHTLSSCILTSQMNLFIWVRSIYILYSKNEYWLWEYSFLFNIFEVSIQFYCIKCEYLVPKWIDSFAKSVYIDDSVYSYTIHTMTYITSDLKRNYMNYNIQYNKNCGTESIICCVHYVKLELGKLVGLDKIFILSFW